MHAQLFYSLPLRFAYFKLLTKYILKKTNELLKNEQSNEHKANESHAQQEGGHECKIHTNLPPEHPIIALWNEGIQNGLHIAEKVRKRLTEATWNANLRSVRSKTKCFTVCSTFPAFFLVSPSSLHGQHNTALLRSRWLLNARPSDP